VGLSGTDVRGEEGIIHVNRGRNMKTHMGKERRGLWGRNSGSEGLDSGKKRTLGFSFEKGNRIRWVILGKRKKRSVSANHREMLIQAARERIRVP